MSDYSFRDFLNHTVNLSPRDKVTIAKNSLDTFIGHLKKHGADDETIADYILAMTRLFVSADVNLVKDEYDFFRAVTGLDVDGQKFYEMTNRGSDPEFVNKMLDVIKKLPEEPRNAAVTYGMMVMGCDESIDYNESELIKRLLAIM